MKLLIKISFLLFLFLFGFNSVYAQKKVKGSNFHENQNLFGGKKKEKSNQSKALSKRKSLFNRKFSAGNADAFASNKLTGGKGLFAKYLNPEANTEEMLHCVKLVQEKFKTESRINYLENINRTIKKETMLF